MIILIFIHGFLKALADLSSEGNKNIPSKWHKSKTHLNKWLLDDSGRKILQREPLWYYPIYLPEYKEKFPYSSTWFVAVTDFWHFMELLKKTTMILGFLFYEVYFGIEIDFLLLVLVYSAGFSIIYEPVKRGKLKLGKKKWMEFGK